MRLDDGEFFGAFETLEAATAAGMQNSPILNAARHGADSSRLGVAAAKGDFGPKLFVEGSYLNRLRQQTGLTQEDEYQVVARMRVPIFAGGRNIGGLRRASAQYAQSKAEYANANLALRETIERSWRQMQLAQTRGVIAARTIEAAEKAVEGLQIEYEAGRRNVIDVLDGQRDLINAQIGRSQADHDYRLAGYELLATIGVLADIYAGGHAQILPQAGAEDSASLYPADIDFGDEEPVDQP